MQIVSDSEPVPAGLTEVRRHYDAGLFRRAWDTLAETAPPEGGFDPPGEVLISRLHSQLGLRRTGRRILTRLWRRHPDHPAVRHHRGWLVLEHRGPVHLWRFLQAHPPPAGASALQRADHLLQGAEVMARLRDFQRAETLLAEAAAIAPELRWLAVTRGRVLVLMDRHAEALENARSAAEADPDCWHLAAEEAEALIALGRDEDALGRLRHHALRFEAPALILQWASLELELEHWSHASDALDRLEAVLPVTSDPDRAHNLRRWLASRRADVCWMRGDAAGAAAWASQVDGPDTFYGRFCARLRQPPPDARRVVLPVGFTRQRHLTCAPATLATLCRFWGRPAEHLAIAEAICHDGTSAHNERAWAEGQGWVAREFTVTPRVARELIDRGLPFTLSSVDPGNAHAQAVIGYDDVRGTILIRDPFERAKNEWVEEAAFKAQAPTGPRGMVIAPPGEEARLAGVSLGDEAAYDLMHSLNRALERHDRAAAAASAAALEQQHAGHRLALLARLALASYDQNPAAAVAALDAQLARHPRDVNAALRRHGWRASDATRETRLAEWAATLKSPAAHPLLWIEYAREISEDGRRRGEAAWWLNRALRHAPNGPAVRLRADLLWAAGRFDEALEWYRTASCMDEFNEASALVYFRAAHARGRTDEALAWLRLRHQRHGRTGSAPARTLAFALSDLDRQEESLGVLSEGLHWRPDDVAHRVHTATQLCQAGRVGPARELLKENPDGTRPSSWHAALAMIDEREKGPAAALKNWELASASAPLDLAPLEGWLRVLESVSGREAARARLLERAARFPHHRPLQRFTAEWEGRHSAQAEEAFLERYLRAEPDDAWAWREIAFARIRQARGAGALEAAQRAEVIEPRHPAVPVALAEVAFLAGDRPAGMEHVRTALREAIDHIYALRLLLGNCHDAGSRLDALAFVRAEITRQHTTGEAIQHFAELAAPHLPWEDILAFLLEARQARPDLWRVGDSLASHLSRMGRVEEALAAAREVVAAFPLLPEPRITLVGLLHTAGRRAEEQAEIDAALAIDASWAWFHRQRALLLEDDGDPAAAAVVLDHLIERQPRDLFARYARARLAWKMEKHPDAVARFAALVEEEPGYDDAWRALAWAGAQSGHVEAAQQRARELVARRPDEARSWLVLAGQLRAPSDFEECCRAYDRALALSPSLVQAVEEKALVLCSAGRIEEALELVRDPRWGDPRPALLRTREAWILRQVGRNDEALERLEAALRDDPTLYVARLWAMEWQSADAAAVHAEELVHQYPNDADAWCALGDCRAKAKQDDRAGEAYERAQRLDPRSRRAFASLFNADLAARRRAEAVERIDRFAPHLPLVALSGFRMEVALNAGDQVEFEKQLRALLAAPEDEPVWFQVALQRLADDRRAWRDKVFQIALHAIEAGDPNVEAAAFAAQLRPGRSARIIRALRERQPGNAMARRGYIRLVSQYGEYKRNGHSLSAVRAELRRLVSSRRTWFSSDLELWGQVGFAYLSLGLNHECAEWLKNWRDHPDVLPWMVNNLVVALLQTGDRQGARSHVHAFLERPFYDDSVMRFHLLEAAWLHLDDQSEAANRHLALVNTGLMEHGFDRAMLTFVNWLGRFSGASPGSLPLGRDERETWNSLMSSLGGYPVLKRDLHLARKQREVAAGKSLWVWPLRAPRPATASSAPVTREYRPAWLVAFLLIALLRACNALIEMEASTPPERPPPTSPPRYAEPFLERQAEIRRLREDELRRFHEENKRRREQFLENLPPLGNGPGVEPEDAGAALAPKLPAPPDDPSLDLYLPVERPRMDYESATNLLEVLEQSR